MSDLISRQALIEHLRRTIEASSNDGDYNEGFNDGMDFAACFASTLPSAQPERKKGHWIEVDDHYNRISGRCSVCGWESHMYEDDVVGMDFCPNCGARLQEGEKNG